MKRKWTARPIIGKLQTKDLTGSDGTLIAKGGQWYDVVSSYQVDGKTIYITNVENKPGVAQQIPESCVAVYQPVH